MNASIEHQRLEKSATREENWQRWGPYLSERQWGTVREDYSENQDAWRYFPHDHARSRAYRWGEDGLLGICDRQCRLCFGFAFWNRNDPILKERLFGLTGPEGNHGEDVKELYYYLDSTPTHSYAKGLYKYPQLEFPYEDLVKQNAARGLGDLEYELLDTGRLDHGRYFDCYIEYAKESPNDILAQATIVNRSSEPAEIVVLPQWWFRNTWTWDCTHEGCTPKPTIRMQQVDSPELDLGCEALVARHMTLGNWALAIDTSNLPDGAQSTDYLFTDNETNTDLHPDVPSTSGYFKDAFHRYVIQGDRAAVNSKQIGTKVCRVIEHTLAPGEELVLRARMSHFDERPKNWFGTDFESTIQARKAEADEFYDSTIATPLSSEQKEVARQAYAGVLWTKQFYHYVVDAWLKGDDNYSVNTDSRKWGRNHDWQHLFNRDVISMPDKWEYPWYAAWDLAFHMLPMAEIDEKFAKDQLLLFLREWYMHPNGAIPAYEWALSDVNPPVHAWACWDIYQRGKARGEPDKGFLARAFNKLVLNFTWWVNRKDPNGNHIFSGGFLGLDNIGVFDRSKPLPTGGHLDQADGTAWMNFFCGHLLRMALELAEDSVAYGDMASKFLEHYMAIAAATNDLHGTGLWDEGDGFYYDHLKSGDSSVPLRVRSLVGLIPLCTPVVLDQQQIDKLPGFRRRTEWFLNNRKDIVDQMSLLQGEGPRANLRLLALPTPERLRRMLHFMLDETEFLSPYGIRSLSAAHRDEPYIFECGSARAEVRYIPGESDSYMFGGNSNWRGPVWLPINYLIVESLRTYHEFFGEDFQVECPTGSGNMCTLKEVAQEIERRLTLLFIQGGDGHRPCHGSDDRYRSGTGWEDLVLFYEYFHGDNGRGLGASHQTGWTALAATMLNNQANSI
ncbi:MAG TPA: glucosidase [Planctomycetaceae bacterium]|nr:glucosidase [Planctomycetaceae bacterium]